LSERRRPQPRAWIVRFRPNVTAAAFRRLEGAVEALRPAPAPATNATAQHTIHAKTVTVNATTSHTVHAETVTANANAIAADTVHGKTVTFAKTVSVNASAAHKIHAQTVTDNATAAHAMHGNEQKTTQADDDAEEEEPGLRKSDAKAGNQTI